ncbi:MAG: hypothetical protein ABL874_00340 [Sphingopyxis sp.]
MTQQPKKRAAGPKALPRAAQAITIAGQRSSLGRGAQCRAASGRRFTAPQQDAFFTRLAETANIKMSAQHAGISVRTIHVWRKKDADFRVRWAQALSDGYADIEMKLLAIARFGAVSDISHEVSGDGVKRTVSRKDHPAAMLRLMTMRKEDVAAAKAHEAEAQRSAYQPNVTKLWEVVDAMRARATALRDAPEGDNAA